MDITELLLHTNICGIPVEDSGLSFFILLTAGFLAGFSHCVGMCGPLVSSFVLQQRTVRSDVTPPLLAMQMGRLTTYILLGILAGMAGLVVRVGVVDRGWQSSMSIVVGVVVIIAALNLLGWWPIHRQIIPTRVLRRLTNNIRAFLGRQSLLANFGLGMSNGLLPCGAVYTMTLLAATSGNPLSGGLTMFIFGLGTLPSMLSIGLFASRLGVRMRHQLYQVAATLILLVGVQLVLRGFAMNGQLSHQSVAGLMLW